MLFYCSVHNINYSIFRVNGVHRLHHTEVNLNFGPDICDVMFGTKHSSEDCVENTNHYIPNILIITCIVMILKYICKTEWVKDTMLIWLITFLSLGIVLLFFSSIILWYLECKKYGNKIENRLSGEGCIKKDTPAPASPVAPIPTATTEKIHDKSSDESGDRDNDDDSKE
jgi:hypothetical protein